MSDPLDTPEDDGYGLLVPFVVCRSQDGPFDDESFVAGFQAGDIDRALAVAATLNASVRLSWTLQTDLLRQVELLALNRGFTHMSTAPIEATEDHDAMPEWTFVTFSQTPIEPS